MIEVVGVPVVDALGRVVRPVGIAEVVFSGVGDDAEGDFRTSLEFASAGLDALTTANHQAMEAARDRMLYGSDTRWVTDDTYNSLQQEAKGLRADGDAVARHYRTVWEHAHDTMFGEDSKRGMDGVLRFTGQTALYLYYGIMYGLKDSGRTVEVVHTMRSQTSHIVRQ